ncbi:MAG: hypothetical protein COA67_10580 [Lutibacter sp.]|nr:MAG: hypothetical protein COA67_10580 [Lutibacter sp.]
MLKQNLLKVLLVLGVILIAFTSCSSESDDPIILSTSETKTGALTTSETWTADRVYELEGKVIVPSGITLTIQAGTIIKGRQGDGLNASALIVARGGKIMAQGTEMAPIIFTTILDNIEVGQKTGTNLDEADVQKWGGIIVLGNARVSVKIGDTEGQIEGIPADATYGTYGGTNDADNSGVITYVSIRHGGISIGDGNEINGLTLGGVGNGTTINYVEVVANLDDGIECFGGSVNINHALVAYQQDDAFDVDQNFSGSFKNSMVVYDNTGDEFLEIDGPENSTHTDGLFTIKNCTFVSKTNDGSVDLKSKAQGLIKNNDFTGLTKFKVSAKLDTDCTTVLTDAYSHYIDGLLEVNTNKTGAILDVYTKSDNGENPPVDCTLPVVLQAAADAIFTTAGNSSSATANGVSQSEFISWTWTGINNKL